MWKVTTLVYKEWSKAFDNLKAVKEEKPDYRLEPDWDKFHEIRLANAIKEEKEWKEFLQRCTSQCPKILI